MKLTSLLGYKNGYKTLGGFGNERRVVYYCDLLINKSSVIKTTTTTTTTVQQTTTSNGSTTVSTSSSTSQKVLQTNLSAESLKSSFEITVKTIRTVSSIESNNSLPLVLNQDMGLRNALFKEVEAGKYALNINPLKLSNASNNMSANTIDLSLAEFPNYKIELVVKNFKTMTNSNPTDANEKSVKELTTTIIDEKKKKLDDLRRQVSLISGTLSNLQLAINLKVLFLKKENQKTIYEEQITKIQEEKRRCLEERDRLQNEYNRLEMSWVQSQDSVLRLSEEITTCKSKVLIIETEIVSAQNKINTSIQKEKERLENLNKECYTSIFYWLNASYFYRVFSTKLVANESEVAIKFAESKLKANSIKLSEVFYPLETDLTFFDEKSKRRY